MKKQFKTLIDGLNHQQLISIVSTFISTEELKRILIEKLKAEDKKCFCENHGVDFANTSNKIDDLSEPF